MYCSSEHPAATATAFCFHLESHKLKPIQTLCQRNLQPLRRQRPVRCHSKQMFRCSSAVSCCICSSCAFLARASMYGAAPCSTVKLSEQMKKDTLGLRTTAIQLNQCKLLNRNGATACFSCSAASLPLRRLSFEPLAAAFVLSFKLQISAMQPEAMNPPGKTSRK